MTDIDTVHLANSVLQLCFAHDIPVRAGQLRSAVDRIATIILDRTGRHVCLDHRTPLLHFKLATIHDQVVLTSYILHAGEREATAATAAPGSPFDAVLRETWREVCSDVAVVRASTRKRSA